MTESCNCLSGRPLYEKYAFEPLKEGGFRLYCAGCGLQTDIGMLPNGLSEIQAIRNEKRNIKFVSESVPDDKVLL